MSPHSTGLSLLCGKAENYSRLCILFLFMYLFIFRYSDIALFDIRIVINYTAVFQNNFDLNRSGSVEVLLENYQLYYFKSIEIKSEASRVSCVFSGIFSHSK